LKPPFTDILINICDWSIFGGILAHDKKNPAPDIEMFLAPRARECQRNLLFVEQVVAEAAAEPKAVSAEPTEVRQDQSGQPEPNNPTELSPEHGGRPESITPIDVDEEQDEEQEDGHEEGNEGEVPETPQKETKETGQPTASGSPEILDLPSWAVINQVDSDGQVVALTEVLDIDPIHHPYKFDEIPTFVVKKKGGKSDVNPKSQTMTAYAGDMLTDVVQILNVYSITPIQDHRFGAPTKTSVERVRHGVMAGPRSTQTSKLNLPEALTALRQELGKRVADKGTPDHRADRAAMIAMLHSLYVGLVHNFKGTNATELTSNEQLEKMYNLDFNESEMAISMTQMLANDKEARFLKVVYTDEGVHGKKRSAEAANLKNFEFFVKKPCI
jgi:hypothetical protein